MMGAHVWGTPAGKGTLREWRINGQGYDVRGSYWGTGQRLYVIETDEGGGARRFFRAHDRAAALQHVRATYPDARVRGLSC